MSKEESVSVELKSPLDTQRALSIAYTPGVAQVSRAIAADHTLAARLLIKKGFRLLGESDLRK